MPRLAKPLTAIEVKRLTKEGFHAVGTVAGLGLSINPQGSKSWVLRTTYGGSRRKMGLGGFPAITLAQATEKARQIKAEIDKGSDPIQAKKANKNKLISEKAKSKTFEECARLFLDSRTFQSEKHSKQWESTLRTYAYPHIGKLLVSEIGIENIKAVLDPIWKSKTQTASRLQGRIKSIIDYAIVSGYREKSNPALWDGFLDSIYQSPKKIKVVKHMDSMPYSKVNEFLQELRKHKNISAKALEFLIFTVVRSDSVRSATWTQIDLDKGVWTIPKLLTKTKKRNHTVPLSSHAIALLSKLERFIGTDLVFPSPQLKKISDNTISKLMRDMRFNKEFKGEGVPHGFRATFSTWRLERTNHTQELGELSLMHEVGDSVYQAYQRSDGLEKRRKIMQDWSSFINKPFQDLEKNKAKVISLKRKAA